MMDQPLARVVALQYCSKGTNQDVLRVHFRTHLDTMETHDLRNNEYTSRCDALKFMALYDFQPSIIEGTYQNVEDEQLVVPIVRADGSWLLERSVLEGGEAALKAADWFGGLVVAGEEETEQESTQGGSGDPDGGGMIGVKVEDQDDDRGVTFEVS